jgi:hypothetical protein
MTASAQTCPAMNPSYQTTQGDSSPSGANFKLLESAPAAHQTGAIVVQVYSGLLNIREEWPSTWMVIREMDDRGCGWVDTSWSELAALKSCSTATIRRHFAAGLGIAFRCYKKYRGGIRIYYTSIVKVCAHYGITDLGGISYELSTSLHRSGANACATAIDAQAGQKQALYAARESLPKGQKKRALDARRYIEPTCDNSVRVKRRSKYFRVSNGFSVPGISIHAVAVKSGYSDRTIKTRLSNNWRLEQDLDLIQKRRVITELDSIDQEIYSELSRSFIRIPDRSKPGKFHLIKFLNGTAYRLGVNVYETSYELRARRFLRNRVKGVQFEKMNK